MKWHTNVEATPISTSVGRHFGFMCLLASKRLLHLTYHKNCISKSLPPQIPFSWLLNCGCHCSPLKCRSRGPNIASHPTIDKCSGVQINLYLKPTKTPISNLHFPSVHPSDLPQNCISNLHYLYIHLSILPTIHTSGLPQELSQTYTNQSIHPAYLKLTLIHPSIWLTTKPVSQTYTIYPSIYLSIHTSDLPQKLSQTYTIHPSILKLTLIHPSIHPSCISNLHYPFIHPSIWLPKKLSNLNYPFILLSIHTYIWLTTTTISNLHLCIHPFIHPSIHLTYHKNYLKLILIHPSIHTSDLPQKLSQTYTNPSIHPIYSLH